MTPTGRVIHKCRMQFPRHCVAPRFHIVGIATFADMIESSFNRIACETAPRMCACTHVGPMARTRARHFERGPDTSSVGPILGAWVRWYACGRRPGAYLGVDVRVTGLTRMFSGSRASGTPGQAPLGPQRRAPCPRHAIVSVCYRSGLYCGRHAALRRDLTAPRRGLTGSKRGELCYMRTYA